MSEKILVIAEKPDMGRNIAAAIEPKAINKRTHLEGERYIITWAIGHLVGLAEPDKYDDRYKKWNLQDLPIIPDSFKLIPNYKTKDQLKLIGELAGRCERLVNACDAGREGQYIFYLIQRYLRLQQPVQRLWISDLTPETIRSGFAGLRDGAEFDNLTKAARARSEADWLIGMNGSRAFTTRHNVLLSVGRVQTPVLALIYDRQILIEAFSSLKYYDVHGTFTQDGTVYRGLWQGERISAQEQADAIVARTSGRTGRVASYEIKETKEYPYKLFDLTLLQREANAKCGFSAKKTLDIAQSLYEKHKVISYPRTNSNYVTEQNVPEMHRALDTLRGSVYDALVQGANKSLVHVKNTNVCNPGKVEDHHAILPTRKKPGSLTPDESKIYDLIVRRFLSHFYPPAEYKVHTVMTEVASDMFKTTVKEQLKLGWKAVYADQSESRGNKKTSEDVKDRGKTNTGADAEEEEETTAPFLLDAARSVQCDKTEVTEKETQPPKPYNEGTLLKAMESAGKQVEDDELRDAMKDSGLGTPATRAATIERLKQVEYIQMQGKRIMITQKGRTAIEVIRSAGVELLASPEMTGHWERRLNEISKGTADATAFMEKVKQFAAMIVDKVRGQQRVAKAAFEGAMPDQPKRGRSGGQSNTDRSRSSVRTKTDGNVKARVNVGAGTSAGVAGVVSVDAPVVIGTCPRDGCGGQIFMGRKGYGCSHYKEGCKFVIWKVSFGKSLTDSMIKTLIEKGSTNKLKLKQSDGTVIEAKIRLIDRSTGTLELDD